MALWKKVLIAIKERRFFNALINTLLNLPLKFDFKKYLIILFDYYAIKRSYQKFSLKDFDKGLRQNQVSNILDNKEIERIIKAFKESKSDQRIQKKEYLVGGMWESIIKQNFKDWYNAVDHDNLLEAKAILENFGRDKISVGISLVGTLPKGRLEKILILNWINNTHYIWEKMTKLPHNVLEYPKNIGNLHGVLTKEDKLIMVASHRLSYFAYKISKLLQDQKDSIIVEIGAGYGGIPYHLFKYFNIKATYIIFDIPEICIISSYFLRSCFPNKKILFYKEYPDIKRINLKEYDIVILPNFEIQKLPDAFCDLIFNSHSLVEMDDFTVKEYLKQIDRICKKYFLSANHELELKYNTLDGDLKTTVNLNQSDYQIDPNKWKEIYKFPEILTNTLKEHEGGYFEFLYEKKNNNYSEMSTT